MSENLTYSKSFPHEERQDVYSDYLYKEESSARAPTTPRPENIAVSRRRERVKASSGKNSYIEFHEIR